MPMSQSDPVLWLIEGLPGSGKTTTAALLYDAAIAHGRNARWWLEEAKDHPVLPATLRRTSTEPGFPHRCVEAFRAFVQAEQGVLILEGAALQSTVRFLFANDAPHALIERYLSDWAAVLSPSTRLLILSVADTADHYGRFVAGRRGPEWMAKLIAYVERTPVAQARGWSGLDGFVQFWTEYQALCLGLIPAVAVSSLVIPAAPDTASSLAPEIATYFMPERSPALPS